MPTPTPDLPPPGISTGLPLIRCPDCGGFVEEYIPGLGGSITGNPSGRRRNDTGVHGGCSFFKTLAECKEILRDRGLLGPAATPEQGIGYPVLVEAPSGFLVPGPVGNPEMFASMEDLKHHVAVQELAIAQLKRDIEATEDLKHKVAVQELAIAQLKRDIEDTDNKLAISQLETDIQDFKGELGAGDKVQKAMMTGSPVRWAKAIVKWFFVANVVVLLFCIAVAMFI